MSDIDYKKLTMEELKCMFKGVHFKTPPMHHQLVSLAFALDLDRTKVNFIHDIGTGKTLVGLYTAWLWRPRSILVVCPNSVIHKTWVKQIRKHTDFTYTVLDGPTDERLDKLNDRSDIYLINYEGLMYVWGKKVTIFSDRGKNLGGGFELDETKLSRHFDCLIFDELHKLKNRESIRTRIAHQLALRAKYVIGLTGTPISTSEMDLWAEYWVLDNGESLGRNFFSFRRSFFKEGFYEWKINGEAARKRLLDKIGHITLRYDREECFDLPDKLPPQIRLGVLTKQQLKLTNNVINDLQIEMDSGVLKRQDVLHKGLRLLQITGGFLPVINPTTGKEECEYLRTNPKMELLLEVLEEIRGKVIVFHQFVPEGRLIEHALKKEGYTYASLRGEVKGKEAEYERFLHDPSVKVLIANPQCGGEGVDELQNICSVMVFYSNAYLALTRRQAEGRIFRKGQQKRCLFIDLALEGSMDEIVLQGLEEGKEMLDNVLHYIREFKYKRSRSNAND
jgi:SNF2 family DNA or RNA helicase